MSVTLHAEAGGKIIEVNLSGKLTKEDYEDFLPEVEHRIKQHGKVRMLVKMHDFHGWTLGGLWQDIKFDVQHFTHVERLALVGQSKWEAGMATFCKPFTTAKVRYFDESKAAEAHDWINEEIAQTA